ncbi:DUF2127 domain-containing protein [Paraburkholderia sp. NMBU_R16]|uniref:DUF2127 domain-containing protein n=1 Tax=Paraburkholderia sp. NMBU_R16 TaxID=2698676 RepID=UPI0015634992|nr:DUF2127 domain-containing protein [Paraburkholderia sp. NMBU_R16]NRO99202.1 DUF2127 domain-containing protein [Paraburkholderia sp. NMBU_R16]
MNRFNNFLDEKRVHLAFKVSLWCKGVFALSEIVAGAATYFLPPQLLLTFVLWVTKEEFVEDPQDLVANFILLAARSNPIL